MDPRYATSPGHVRNRTGLIATLDTTLPEYPSAHQTSLLTAAGVPVAQINHVGGALSTRR
jgi:crotonobetainyl-CoA:carnitine CoA-transferase CaiB-like acyl-CoA transferase